MGATTSIGTQVGNYRLLEQLGEGGMGKVYLAEHLHMGHQVAIKVLLAEIAVDDEMVTRLFDEARVLNRLHHPSLVQVFDCGIDPDMGPYMVMELLRGESLGRFLKRQRRPPFGFVLTLLERVADALAVAHRAGIVHRDLKPANIYLLEEGGAKLLDFGVARLDSSMVSRPRTSAFAALGTPHYMAPEQIDGSAIDHRADVYALGILAFRLLTGRLPYVAENSAQVLVMQKDAPIPRASERSPRLPPDVDDVLFCALAKDPERRFASCSELVAELSACLGALVQAEGARADVQSALPRRATEPAIPLPSKAPLPQALITAPTALEQPGLERPAAGEDHTIAGRISGGVPAVSSRPRPMPAAAPRDRRADPLFMSQYETSPRHIMEPPDAPRLCPHCAVDLVEQDFNDIEIDACPGCGGIWFDGGEFEQVAADSLGGELARDVAAQAGSDKLKVAQLCRPVGQTKLRCPACGDPLINNVFIDDEGLAVDICQLCDGVWLDKGELARFQRGQARKLLGRLVGSSTRHR